LGRLAWGRGLDSTVSGQGPVAGCCECGDEPSGSCTTWLVSENYNSWFLLWQIFFFFFLSNVKLTRQEYLLHLPT
jgi:hypothetical protein